MSDESRMAKTSTRRTKEPTATRFINADLDVVVLHDLKPLVAALDGVGFYCLNDERRLGRKRFATFELNSRYGPSAEKCARTILARLDRLDRAGRSHLAASSKRVLDFGYDVGDTWGFGDALSVDTLVRLTEYGIDFALTLYPLHAEREAKR